MHAYHMVEDFEKKEKEIKDLNKTVQEVTDQLRGSHEELIISRINYQFRASQK